MTFEELKEEAKKIGGRPVVIDYKDYLAGYALTSKTVQAIRFMGMYFVEDGDILMKFDEVKKLLKIKNIPYPGMCDKMLTIMKALQ